MEAFSEVRFFSSQSYVCLCQVNKNQPAQKLDSFSNVKYSFTAGVFHYHKNKCLEEPRQLEFQVGHPYIHDVALAQACSQQSF